MDCAKSEIQDSVAIAEEVNIGDFETTYCMQETST